MIEPLVLPPELSPVDACRALSDPAAPALILDGDGWSAGPLVALEPRLVAGGAGGVAARLAELDGWIDARRQRGGSAATGLAVLVGYEFLDGAAPFVVLAVDRSLVLTQAGATLTVGEASERDAVVARLCDARRAAGGVSAAARSPHTSLPRERYLRAVDRVRRHIARGDVYQANLCQRLDAEWEGDAMELHGELVRQTPAPRSAFLRTPEFALASVSPETFLSGGRDGSLETWPIKGTRPRGATPDADRAAARELLASEKDRAELVMIVDLERNDLSRVCRPGSVVVDELAALRSFPAVHHLVARVRGELREGVPASEILRATFPGGSITGAPKIRAMELLRAIEPVRRGFFTGSLFWFGDDGSLESSLLIRSVVLQRGRAFVGAGGGIVADSEPEQEWLESNHKARALTRALGFDPLEAL